MDKHGSDLERIALALFRWRIRASLIMARVLLRSTLRLNRWGLMTSAGILAVLDIVVGIRKRALRRLQRWQMLGRMH